MDDEMKLETSLTSEQVEALIRDHVSATIGPTAKVVSVKAAIGRVPEPGSGFMIKSWAIEVTLTKAT